MSVLNFLTYDLSNTMLKDYIKLAKIEKKQKELKNKLINEVFPNCVEWIKDSLDGKDDLDYVGCVGEWFRYYENIYLVEKDWERFRYTFNSDSLPLFWVREAEVCNDYRERTY